MRLPPRGHRSEQSSLALSRMSCSIIGAQGRQPDGSIRNMGFEEHSKTGGQATRPSPPPKRSPTARFEKIAMRTGSMDHPHPPEASGGKRPLSIEQLLLHARAIPKLDR